METAPVGCLSVRVSVRARDRPSGTGSRVSELHEARGQVIEVIKMESRRTVEGCRRGVLGDPLDEMKHVRSARDSVLFSLIRFCALICLLSPPHMSRYLAPTVKMMESSTNRGCSRGGSCHCATRPPEGTLTLMIGCMDRPPHTTPPLRARALRWGKVTQYK